MYREPKTSDTNNQLAQQEDSARMDDITPFYELMTHLSDRDPQSHVSLGPLGSDKIVTLRVI